MKSQRKTQFCYVIDLICNNTSPRLDYILDYLSRHLGVKITQISTIEASDSTSVRLNYSNQALDNCISIYNSNFLFDLSSPELQREPDVLMTHDVRLFNAEKDRYKINFDLLSAIFYCLSRYEEYYPFEADAHGRFTGEQSHAHKNGYLKLPVVDQWVNLLRSEIRKLYSLPLKPTPQFEILPTIDVDSAWAFQHRTWMHSAGSLLKNAVTMKWDRVSQQRSIQIGQQDPYDRFDYLQTTLEAFHTIYFFLLHFERPYDTAHYIKTPAFAELITRVGSYCEVGMHPSYASHSDSAQVKREQQVLSKILNRPITSSRQHFLKLSLPDTYQQLIDLGIEADYSMGYSDRIGFRAGTSRPFKWYNVATEKPSDLTIYPFSVMDVTLKDYLQLSPTEAIDDIHKLKQAIQKEGGQFSFIWHNSSFATMDGWAGWQPVFESLLKA